MNEIFNDAFMAQYYAVRSIIDGEENKKKLDRLVNTAAELAMRKGIDVGIQRAMAKVDETIQKKIAEEETKGEEA
jgi:polysaccharide deacetylase 2 family uncharacterized protein YibQ